MSLHDAYARLTPFEIVFGDRARAEALAADVGREAAARGVDDESPGGFFTLGSVEAFVHEVAGADAPPESAHSLASLAFHGVHFSRAGCRVYLLGTHVSRLLVEGAPEGAPEPPAPAGYLQLPQHLFWSGGVGEAPESVDGVFWTATRQGVLQALLVRGLRPDRPGMGIVPLPEAPLSDAVRWLEADVRDGEEYTTAMPGSELDRLYGVETAGEVLKLLARFFAYASSVPEGLRAVPAAAPAQGSAADGPAVPEPSRLGHVRVSLDDERDSP